MSKHNQNIPHNHLVRQEQTTVAYSGPIPHPNDLARYEEILPGAAERIMKMAELQAEHRRALEIQSSRPA